MEEDMKQCPFCGEPIKAKAQKCKFCGKWLNEGNQEQTKEEESPKTKKCPVCGEEILAVATKCKFCGEMLNGSSNPNIYYGYKPLKPLPYELQRFNWGAFCFSWIWGIYNNSYLTFLSFASLLLTFIPFVGGFAPLGLSIWFGIKGNEWAWNNKDWKDAEHFNSVQIAWAKAAIVCAAIAVWIMICFGIFVALCAMYASIFGTY